MEIPRTIHIADGSPIQAVGIGTISLFNTRVMPAQEITIGNVLFAPKLTVNLLLVAWLENKEIYIQGKLGGIDLVYYNKTLATAERVGTSYVLSLSS